MNISRKNWLSLALVFFINCIATLPVLACESGEHSEHAGHAVKSVPGAKNLGKAFAESDVKTLDLVMKDATGFVGKNLVVEAKVEKVCENEGCWFESKTASGESVRVTVKDYAFAMPADVKGKTVRMAGQLREKTLSVAAQRHYLKDTKAPKKAIEAVKEAKKVLEFEATGVRITG